jgi:hypothetical protein
MKAEPLLFQILNVDAGYWINKAVLAVELKTGSFQILWLV